MLLSLKINDAARGDAIDFLDFVIPVYNLSEYGDNYSLITGNL